MKKYLCLFLTALLFPYSCTQPVVEYFGTVSGIVKDHHTDMVLSGVKVTLSPGGVSQITGQDGAFTFDDLEQGEYTLAFVKDGYAADNQKVSVKPGIISNVQMALSPVQPLLKVEPEVLDFSDGVSSLAIDIINEGKGTLNWKISEKTDWLSCDKTEGKVADKPESVVFSVSREGLTAGQYSETVVVSSDGGSAVIQVKVLVSSVQLAVEPSVLDFGIDKSSIQLKLTHNGNGKLDYSVKSANSWLVLSKNCGSFSDTDYLNAIVSRDGLSGGEYTSLITFTTDDGEVHVPVRMEVKSLAPPTVTIENVSGITYNSAKVTGTVFSIGSSKVNRYGVCYSAEPEPTVEDHTADLGDCASACSFDVTLTALAENTKYYCRAFAENEAGISYSTATLSFTTAGIPSPAVVKTGEVFNLTAESADVSGLLVSMGNYSEVTSHGHVWKETRSPVLEDAEYVDLGKLSVLQEFTSHLTSLKPNTSYYVRAYAVNEKGVSYGDETVFTTEPAEVKLTTYDATEITYSSAVIEGKILDDGGNDILEKGICWSGSPSPGIEDNVLRASNDFRCTLTGLEQLTEYYACSYVRTGSGDVYYGNIVSFTTLKHVELPTVSSGQATSSWEDKIYVYGASASDGGGMISDFGFVYSTSHLPTIENADLSKVHPLSGSSSDFNAYINDLAPNTTYYIRAYAANEAGISYGNELTATTASPLPDNHTSGLLAYYTFEESYSNIMGSAPDGSGSGVSYVSGLKGTKALKFDAESSTFSVPSAMIDDDEYTISFWAKDMYDGHIYSVKSSSAYFDFTQMLSLHDNKFKYLRWQTYYSEYRDKSGFTHDKINSSEWHMITFVSAKTSNKNVLKLSLYIDGVFSDTINLAMDAGVMNTGTRFVFGGGVQFQDSSNGLDGVAMTIDNLRVYSNVLDADDVKQIYEYEK